MRKQDIYTFTSFSSSVFSMLHQLQNVLLIWVTRKKECQEKGHTTIHQILLKPFAHPSPHLWLSSRSCTHAISEAARYHHPLRHEEAGIRKSTNLQHFSHGASIFTFSFMCILKKHDHLEYLHVIQTNPFIYSSDNFCTQCLILFFLGDVKC